MFMVHKKGKRPIWLIDYKKEREGHTFWDELGKVNKDQFVHGLPDYWLEFAFNFIFSGMLQEV